MIFDYFLDGSAATGRRPYAGTLPAIGCPPEQVCRVKRDRDLPVSTPHGGAGVVAKLLTSLNKPCYFLVSHFHKDHFQPFILQIYEHAKREAAMRGILPLVHLVMSTDIKRYRNRIIEKYTDEITFLSKCETMQSADLQVEAYGSTDVGVSFAVQLDDRVFFHAGDLNNWYVPEDGADAEEAEKGAQSEMRFIRELALIRQRYDRFDIAMFPCDPTVGTGFMSGATQFIREFSPKMFVAMHTREKPGIVAAEMLQLKNSLPISLYRGAVLANEDRPFCLDRNRKTAVWIPEYSGDFSCIS